MLDVTGFRFDFADEDTEEGALADDIAINDFAAREVSMHDIAIVGISAELPLAEDADHYWRILRDGKDAVASFPKRRRQDVEAYIRRLGLDPETVAYFDGAYLEEIDKFDPGFFRMSPRDASLTSPSQRLFLQTAWKTIEDAGYGGGKLAGTKTGVYIGYCADAIHDYKRLIAEEDPSGVPIAIPGNLTSVIASRISYLLDLKGPALSVDTACSSSLVAVHLACQAIRSGDCDMALAGSVKTLTLPIDTGMRVGIESSDGRARTFGDGADGTGMGEGSAAVLLKPLAKALADGDSVYAVIKGSAINQDGSSAGITAPNAAAQEEAIVQAWLDADIDPSTVSYIEAHGTGTKLGDPIEIEGISRAFRRFTDERQFCAIGSVKTNLGHLDNAAGIVGLLKAVLALKHKELPPSLHFERPNRHIDFIESPVYVNDKLKAWETGTSPRRCGVSAFGLSGTNCHIVLEEAPTYEEQEGTDFYEEGGVFALSARSGESLARSVRKYADWFEERGGSGLNIADLCYTASTGRSHYDYRIAAVVRDGDELAALLRAARNLPPEKFGETGFLYSHSPAAEGSAAVKPIGESGYGQLSAADKLSAENAARELIDRICGEDDIGRSGHSHDKADLERLSALYVQGADIPWERLYAGQRRCKLNLPTYMFDKVRCWVDGDPSRKRSAAQAAGAATASGGMTAAKAAAADAGEELEVDIEEAVAEAWARVLGVRPGPNDDFFALGGHSLSAVQLIANLQQEFGIELSLSEVFRSPTVASLAEAIRDAARNDSDKITPCAPSDRYPVSSAQKRLFILSELHGDNTGYNMPALMEIEGAVDKERLVQALQTIIDRHESLRTTFGWEDGEIVQRVHPAAEPSVEFLEAGPEGIDGAVRAFIRPFQLDRLPLLRIGLLRTDARKHLLLFDMHHIVSDGFSVGKLAGDFARIYGGVELPPLPIQYKDYAAWQEKRFGSESFLEHERYWKRQFAVPAPKLRLPTDRDRTGEAGASAYEGKTVFFRADQSLSRRLEELAASTGTTLFMVLLAAYNVLLSKYSGQEDIVVGSAVAGRTRAELEPLIGMFVNTLALRNYPSKEKSFRRFLAEVKENAREAFEHQEYPFERLAAELGDAVRPGQDNPLFDTMFVHQNTALPELDFGEAKLRPYSYDFGISKLDLTLQSWANGPELTFSLEYRTALFRHDTMVDFSERFLRMLELAAGEEDFALRDADLLEQSERSRIEENIRAGKETVFADFEF
ncbi:condensation domain-containing protein [Cohnella faecalis]|uniref:Polyketide synthase n=1 Tax=Cohnella faecalis TaxID=2315694 RepID=A0A398CV30_9BACL|nr:condensation domain-containing protein [Cohnella faecalis]RIE04408.1 polyketide synthase [Cohnella faecalis]